VKRNFWKNSGSPEKHLGKDGKTGDKEKVKYEYI
jgi:hypothetical protein